MGAMKPSGRSRSSTGVGAGENPRSWPEVAGVRHHLIDLPSLRMHVAEAGTGPPLVLLHGFPQHWWAWRRVLPALAAQYRVICPDLRGAGWSDAPPAGYTSEQLVADVVALLDALELDEVSILGHDWGGMIGYRVCLAHPERVQKFIALAAPHPYPDLRLRALLYLWRIWPMFAIATPGLGPWLLRTGRQRLPRWLMSGDTRDPSVFPPEDIDAFVSRLRDPARASAASTLYRDFILREAKLSAAGAYRRTRLTTPTLSLYGTVLYDARQSTREYPDILSGHEGYADNLRHEHVPGTGYYLAEERPDVVVRRTLEFLSGA